MWLRGALPPLSDGPSALAKRLDAKDVAQPLGAGSDRVSIISGTAASVSARDAESLACSTAITTRRLTLRTRSVSTKPATHWVVPLNTSATTGWRMATGAPHTNFAVETWRLADRRHAEPLFVYAEHGALRHAKSRDDFQRAFAASDEVVSLAAILVGCMSSIIRQALLQ